MGFLIFLILSSIFPASFLLWPSATYHCGLVVTVLICHLVYCMCLYVCITHEYVHTIDCTTQLCPIIDNCYKYTNNPGYLKLQALSLYALEGALSFSILVGMCHDHIHHNFPLHSSTHFGNLGSEVHLRLAVGSQEQHRGSSEAVGYTQGCRCQDRTFPHIQLPVGPDTTTVRDTMTPDKTVLRSLAEGHLGTGELIRGLCSSSPETSTMTLPAHLQNWTGRELGIRTWTHNENLGTGADAYAPVAEAEPVRWNTECTAVTTPRMTLGH